MADQPDFDKAREEAAAVGMPGFPDGMDGLTELEGLVAQSHEVYTTHLDAGFSPSQSLYLVGVMITNNPGNPPIR